MTPLHLDRRTLLRGAGPLALLGAVSTACASRTVSGTPKFGLSAVPTTPAPTTSPTASPTPENVTLDLWAIETSTGRQRSLMDAADSYAKADSDVIVKVTWESYSSVLPKLQASAAAGVGPDLLQYWPDVDLIQQGLWAPVDDLISSVRSDYLRAALQTVTFKDRVYGIPIAADTGCFCYRKSVLSQAHVSTPMTIDELIAAAKTLTKAGRKGIGVGVSAAEVEVAGPILWSAGLDFLTEDHRPGFTGARAETVLGKLQHMFAEGSAVMDAPPEDVTGFLNGSVAIQWARSGQLPQLSTKFGDDLGIFPFPRLDGGGNPSVPVSTTSLILNAKGRHLEQAQDLARWLGVEQKSYLSHYNLDADLSLPPLRSIAQSASRLRRGVGQQVLQLSTRYGRAEARPDWNGAMYAALTGAMRNILLEKKKVSSELAAAASAVRSELKTIYK